MSLESIAFIPDGNRRYASKHGLNLAKAYEVGTHRTWDVIQWVSEYPQIKVATFYALSLENVTRSKTELDVLFRIFEKEADKILAEEYYKTHDFAIRFLGRLENFPKNMQEKMNEIQSKSKDYAKKIINVAIGYNGRAEIVDAAKKLAREFAEKKIDVNDVNEETFRKYLYHDFHDPDMIVRTGYTKRLSGFLTYQSTYSELYFLDKFWPEFSKEDLGVAIASFDEKQRRFGK